jgi:hypothetical protein
MSSDALQLTKEEIEGLRELTGLLNNTDALQLTKEETEGLRKLIRHLNHEADAIELRTTATATVTGPLTTEEAENLLGKLIRLLNPYTRIMRYPPGDPPANGHVVPRVADDILAKLAQFQLEVDKPLWQPSRRKLLVLGFQRTATDHQKSCPDGVPSSYHGERAPTLLDH